MTITKSYHRLIALAGGAALALAMMGAVAIAPAQAAGLSASQVQAIVSLLASFGADSATISNVTAALYGQATTGTGASCPVLTRSLQLGSTGADVMSLQKFLNASANTRVAVSGAGSPGLETTYFGPATRAAVIKFQAANSVSPIGVVGPATRAAIAAVCGTTGGNTGGGNTGNSSTLNGGEADLRSFDLIAGNDLREGDTNQEIAVAKFDVRGGDVQVQRVTVELTAQASSTSASKLPWKFISGLAVYSDGKKVGSVDASSKSDWDKSGDTYSIDIPVNAIVRQGDKAELSVRADAQNSVDSSNVSQAFKVVVPTNGIRAVDAKGLQQYAGRDGDSITLSFDNAANGKLTVRTDSSNPNAGVLVADDQNTSDTFDVLKFQLKNTDTADTDINTLTFTTAAGTTQSNNVIRKATLKLDGKSYDGTIASSTIKFSNLNASVNGNDTINGTLSVQLYSQAGHYNTSGEFLTVSLLASNVDAEGSQTGDASTVSGSANGNKQTIAVNAGINVAGSTMSGSQTYNSNNVDASYGTFALKFNVTASGNDVYIPKTVEALGSATAPQANTGVVVLTDLNAPTASSSVTVSMTSTADTDTNNTAFYVVRDGDTETFTVLVTINPNATGDFQVGLDKIRFSSTDTGFGGIQTLDVDQSANQFHTDSVNIRS